MSDADSLAPAPPGYSDQENITTALKERRRLADAMRDVIEGLVTSNAPEQDLKAAADGLEKFASRLKTHPQRKGPWGHAETSTAGDVGGFFDGSPIIGASNPMAPPLKLWKDGDLARGEVRFRWQYEGPPGHVHGGYVAAVFDELLGFVQSLSGQPGMTGTLVVKYRSPTPLYENLQMEGKLDRVEGRKVFTSGRLFDGDTLCAEAEGIFISFRPEMVDVIRSRREKLQDEKLSE